MKRKQKKPESLRDILANLQSSMDSRFQQLPTKVRNEVKAQIDESFPDDDDEEEMQTPPITLSNCEVTINIGRRSHD